MILHDRQLVLRGGAPLAKARAALVLMHGRGASAEDIFSLGEAATADAPDVALIAPQAAGNSWYPQRFLAPTARNEPYLSSALGVIANLLAEASENRIRYDRVILAGFSQGACLALEFASRHPRRYGAVVGLSGALIGPPRGPRRLSGSMDATPVYLGCDEEDAHIPLASVEESAEVFAALGAQVTKSIFKGMGHTVNDEELGALRNLVQKVSAST
ncbi:MAG TPA: dienelactone hydrolase family protein [Opitutaceae bacterium]|nr:dienelactone hydrolase family protein [Opitutaceae bacterium]